MIKIKICVKYLIYHSFVPQIGKHVQEVSKNNKGLFQSHGDTYILDLDIGKNIISLCKMSEEWKIVHLYY